jgi:GNAT superfamily N-acetyltransferase
MSEVKAIPGYTKDEVIHQVELNLRETWANFGIGPGCTLHDEEDVLWFETPIPILPYNTVLRFQVEDHADERIDALVKGYADRNVAQLWIVMPSSRPKDLAQRLAQRGLHEIEVVPGMARLLDNLPEPPPLPAGIEIREAVDEHDLVEVINLAAWRWGVPDEYRTQYNKMIDAFNVGKYGSRTRFWLAWKDGKVVSKIGMYNGSGSAGVYAVVTLPEVRGMGIASILMDVAMKAAREMGQKLCVLDSSPPAENLYKRLGFITVADFPLYSSISGVV